MALDRILHLGLPYRTQEEVRREREEQGRTATGEWLPWDDFDLSTDRLREQVGMYISMNGDEP